MDRARIQWDDEYILDNWEYHRNWLSLNRAYDRAHGTVIRYNTFKSHCHRLGLDFHYSAEQQEWLREFYPDHGYVVTAEEFNKRYNTNRSPNAVKNQCKRMGLRVEYHRRQARGIENSHQNIHPVGSIVVKQHGEPYLKTENGYKQLKRIVYGKVPRGKVLIHLDGNQANCEKDNLYPVSRAVLARMTKNRFWSENGIITKTGAMCCELEDIYMKRKERCDEW